MRDFWNNMDYKEQRTFIFQCVMAFAMVLSLVYLIYLSFKVSNMIEDQTVKTTLNYITSYFAVLSSMMAFMIVTLFDLYHVTMKKLSRQDQKIRTILLRDYDEVLCEYCYCRNVVQELELDEWLKDNPEFAKDKPIEE